MDILNDYYDFTEKEKDIIYFPDDTKNLIVKIDNNSDYKLKVVKNKTIKKYYMKQLGANSKTINEYERLNNIKHDKVGQTKHGYIDFYGLGSYINKYAIIRGSEGKMGGLRVLPENPSIDEQLKLGIYEYINTKADEIKMHYNLSLTKYRLYNLLHIHDLLKINKSINSLFMYQQESLLSIEDYFLYRENISDLYLTDNVDVVKILELKNTNKNHSVLMTKLQNIYNFNYIDIKDTFCEKSFTSSKKYDFISMGGYLYSFTYKFYNEVINSQQIFTKMLLIFKYLNTKGDAILYVGDLFSKIMTDIIVILSAHFKEVYITKTTTDAATRMYKCIVLKNYKGITNKKLEELENIRLSWFTYDNSCGLNWKENHSYYINELLKDKFPTVMNQIKVFNICEHKRKIFVYNNIFRTFEKLKNSDSKDDMLNKLYTIIDNNVYIAKSFLEKINIQPLDGKFSTKNIFHTMIKTPVVYNFYNNYEDNKNTINMPNSVHIINKKKLLKCKNQLNIIKRQIDYFDYNIYDLITKKIKVYNNLKKHISLKLGVDVSAAFLKMWEILTITKIINRNSQTYKSFSLCESPGQFVLSIHYYLKTKTKNENFIWHANSLNPYNNKIKYKIPDNYGYIKKYPDKWLFGKDNTGDITNLKNIQHMKNNLPEDLNLITSDCGKRTGSKRFNLQEKDMIYLNISQIRAILYILPVGGDCIFKTFLPLVIPLNISLIYIMHLYFENIKIYKPGINPSSSEVYVICKNYKNKISEELLLQLFNITEKNIKLNEYIIPISQSFIVNYTTIICELMNKNMLSVKKSIDITKELLSLHKNKSADITQKLSNLNKNKIEKKLNNIIYKDKDRLVYFWKKNFNFVINKNKIKTF